MPMHTHARPCPDAHASSPSYSHSLTCPHVAAAGKKGKQRADSDAKTDSAKRRIEFRDGSVLEVSLSGAESPTLRVLKRSARGCTRSRGHESGHYRDLPDAPVYRGFPLVHRGSPPVYRDSGTGQNASEDEAEEEDDEAYEEAREEEYDASVVQTDSAPVPQPTRSRAAMLLTHIEAIYRVANQPGHNTSRFDPHLLTDVLITLGLLMKELDMFLDLGHQRYQRLLNEFSDVILRHFNSVYESVGDGDGGGHGGGEGGGGGDGGGGGGGDGDGDGGGEGGGSSAVEGDGESGLSAESQRSHKRRRTEDGDERCM